MPATFAAYIGEGHTFDRLTRAVSRSIGDLPKSSHLELLYSPLPSPSAQCISASKRDGFQVREKFIEFDPDHWRFWTLPNINGSALYKQAQDYLEMKYDLIGAALCWTPFARDSLHHIFCSELMGLLCDMPRPWTLTPSDWEYHARVMGAEMKILGGRS